MSFKKLAQYVSAVCVMVATALCWWDVFYFLILLILAGWLLLPMVVVVIVSWCMNLRRLVRRTSEGGDNALFVLDSVALVFLIAYLTIGNAQQRCDADIMERHLAKKARRSGKHHLKGPAKRTEEDDRKFAESFERMIQEALA